MDIGIGNNGNWQHSYRSAALRRKKRAEEGEAGTALVPLGSRGNVAGLAHGRALIGVADRTHERSVEAVATALADGA